MSKFTVQKSICGFIFLQLGINEGLIWNKYDMELLKEKVNNKDYNIDLTKFNGNSGVIITKLL